MAIAHAILVVLGASALASRPAGPPAAGSAGEAPARVAPNPEARPHSAGPSQLAPLPARREILRNAVAPELARQLMTCCPADDGRGPAEEFARGVGSAWSAYVETIVALDGAIGEAATTAGATDLDGRRRRLAEEMARTSAERPRSAEEADAQQTRLEALRETSRGLDAEERALWVAHARAVTDHVAAVRRLGSEWLAAASTPSERVSAERAGRRAVIGLVFPPAESFEAAYVNDFGDVLDLTLVLRRAAAGKDALGTALRELGVVPETLWIPAGGSEALAEATRIVDEALVQVAAERLHDVGEQIATGAPPAGLAPGTPESHRFQTRLFKQLARGLGALDHAIALLRPAVSELDPTLGAALDAEVRRAVAPRLSRALWVERGHADGIDAWLSARQAVLDADSASAARAILETRRSEISALRERVCQALRERVVAGAAGAASAMDGGERVAELRALRTKLIERAEQTLADVASALEPSPAAAELRAEGPVRLEIELKAIRPRGAPPA